MAFEKFMNIPSDEYELLTQLAHEVKDNFNHYHGQNFYIHLSAVGEQKSLIYDVKSFDDHKKIAHYLYVERNHEACIIFRSDADSFYVLLYGERNAAAVVVGRGTLKVTYGPVAASLPSTRKGSMSRLDRKLAFDDIKDSLHEFSGKKVV